VSRPKERLMAGIAVPGLGSTPKTAEGAIKLYDEWADTYDDSLRSWGYEAPEHVTALLTARLSGKEADAKVLDLGCGTGLGGVALVKGGFKGQHVGVDISPKSVELSEKLGCYPGGVFVGSLEESLPANVADKGPFDAVICIGVLSYVHSYDIFWREAMKALVPGGYLVATHRIPFWENDEDAIQTEAAKLIASGDLSLVSVSEPMPYMPKNPDPLESIKRIQYIVFRKNVPGDKRNCAAGGCTIS